MKSVVARAARQRTMPEHDAASIAAFLSPTDPLSNGGWHDRTNLAQRLAVFETVMGVCER